METYFSEYFAHPLAPVLTITLAVLVILLLHRWMEGLSTSTLQTKLGAGGISAFWFNIAAFFWAVLFGLLFAGLVWTIFGIVTAAIPKDGQGDEVWAWRFSVLKLASLTAVLGAVVALPMSLVRLGFTRAQNQTAEEALYNEKMNAAVADLHAQRQVTEWYTDKDGQKHAANGWQDDITRRNGAIDTLRGLATVRPELLERIDQMLSVYLRELTREYPPDPVPKDATPEEQHAWASELEPARSDMNNSVVALSKLPRTKEQMMANDLPDLAEVNMQGFRISGVSLPKANLLRAELQGADLIGAELQGANLSWAELQGANLIGAELQGANLLRAKLQGANLTGAKLQGANLLRAKFDYSTSFTAAMPDWAAVKEVDLTNIPKITDHLQVMFGDASVILPEGVDPPDHWPKTDLEWGDFVTAWRDWQRAGGFDPDNPE